MEYVFQLRKFCSVFEFASDNLKEAPEVNKLRRPFTPLTNQPSHATENCEVTIGFDLN